MKDMNKKLLALIILDGYGYNPRTEGNAVYAANTPNMDKYLKMYPNTLINASGMYVGLPDGQMGNSEVGHTNIGAGRIVYQELTRISKSIKDGDFFKNKTLLGAIENCKKHNSALHTFGLVSDGGVHSHIEHLYGVLELAKREGLSEVYVHCFMDGRDVSPTSGVGFIKDLQAKMKEIGVGKIASVMGRYYAMDRDNRWERVEKAYSVMVYQEGEGIDDVVSYMDNSYKNDVTDEFIVPAFVKGTRPIRENDSVICFNFRPDRAREITRTLVDPEFKGFERKFGFFPLYYVCMTVYDATMPNVSVAFTTENLTKTFGEYISSLGLRQLRIAETEKYAHVTFFFNGGKEEVYEGEDRCLIPSPKVATYDLKPEMSAYEVTEEALRRIDSGIYDVIILNFANCDMVGHTGVFDAAKAAVEAVDICLGKLVDAILAKDGIALITADHGNADQMIDYETGEIFTAHTTNPVPFVVVGNNVQNIKLREKEGKLADIAPTMLEILGFEQPAEMTGESLIVSK